MAVAYSSVGPGAGTNGNFNPSLTVGWNHTVNAGDIVFVTATGRCGGQNGAAQNPTLTATGVTPTLLAQIAVGSEQFLIVWVMTFVTAGAKTFSCTVGNGGNTGRSLIANSDAYSGVGSLSVAVTGTGSGTAVSISTTPGGSQDLAFFAVGLSGGQTTAYTTGTSRGSNGDGTGFSRGDYGDAAATLGTYTATISSSTGWGALVIIMKAPAGNRFFLMF